MSMNYIMKGQKYNNNFYLYIKNRLFFIKYNYDIE